MPTEPGTLVGESLPGADDDYALNVPDDVIEALQAEAAAAEVLPPEDRVRRSAVARLQFALGTKSQAVKAMVRANQLLALANAGHTHRQIAKMLGLKPNTVKHAMWRARKNGRLNDLRAMLEHDTSALAVDRVNSAIRKGGDKAADVAIKHLEGMGFYKNHSNIKNEGGAAGQMPPLQINVVVKNEFGAAPVTAETFDVSEACVGVPRLDE